VADDRVAVARRARARARGVSRQAPVAPDRRPDRRAPPPVRPPGPQGLEPWTEPVAADRLLLFSDAVFAISATLLVLDIRIAPGLGSAQLSQALRDQLPAVAAYAFSFGVIGQLWLFHHRTFGFIARVDTALLVRSLVLLALIAFIPFPVRLLSDYHDQPAAVAIYMATFTAATTVQRLVWVYATGHPHLLSRPVPEKLLRRYNLVLTTTPLGFGVLIPISLLAPRVAIGI